MLRNWFALLVLAIPLSGLTQNIDLLILEKKYDEALIQIGKSLEIQPDDELYLKQAILFRQISRPLSALKSLENAIALDSTSSRCLAEYADLQTELGNPFNAVRFYQKATLYSPDDFNLKYRLGRALISTENYQKAHEIFMMIRYKDSTNVVYNKQLGLTALLLGKTDQALDLFELVLEQNPNDMALYQYLITLYTLKKDAVNVVRTADRALYFSPENSSVSLREAQSLFALKEYEEAIPAYKNYLARKDSVFEVLKSLGISQYFVEEHTGSRQTLERCFAQNQKDPLVNFYLGLVCRKLVDFPKSLEYLNLAAASIKSTNLDEIYHCMGQVYGLQREFEKSVEALKEAYDCNPSKKEILVEIASTYEEFKQERKPALDYYTKYLLEAGDSAVNSNYAKERITRIKQPNYRIKK